MQIELIDMMSCSRGQEDEEQGKPYLGFPAIMAI
jgi:hypothetical protein